jgi:hypothetical protein
MGEPSVRFGDKYFLYGQYLQNVDDFSDYEYNAVMGYMTVGGFLVVPVESIDNTASIPGFVVDVHSDGSFDSATATPFSKRGLIDVTDKLARSLPLPAGTKVWMPTTL